MKKTLFTLFVLGMACLLVACGGGSTGNTDVPAAQDTPSTPGQSTPAPTTPATPASPAAPAEILGPEGQSYGGILRIIGCDSSAQVGLPWECQTINQATLAPFAECLLTETTVGEILPFLAESFEPDLENSEIRMKLREDVRFSDGSPFNAEAVRWNFQMSKDARALNPAILGTEVRDEYEIAILLDGYLNSGMNLVCSRTFGFVSKENYEKNGEAYAREHPVGTGPYLFKESVPGYRVVFEKNDNYWMEGRPFLDGLEYYEIVDFMTQVNTMLSTGSDAADILDTVQVEQVAQLRDSGVPVTLNNLPFGPASLNPSSRNEDSPFAKLEVRQAVAYAIDRQALCDARGFGILTPAYQLIPEGFKGHLDNPDYITYDPAKAKQLLAQAGYPNGFTTELRASVMSDRDMVVAIASMLEEVGITCDLAFLETAAMVQAGNSTGWEGLSLGGIRSLPNMTSTFRLNFDPDYQFAISMWRPEEMRPIYVSARSTLMLQNDIMQDLHTLFMDNMVSIPLYDTYDTFIIKENVHDSGFAEWGANTWWMPHNAWKS